jgi:hypothetical protein
MDARRILRQVEIIRYRARHSIAGKPETYASLPYALPRFAKLTFSRIRRGMVPTLTSWAGYAAPQIGWFATKCDTVRELYFSTGLCEEYMRFQVNDSPTVSHLGIRNYTCS